MYFQGVIWVDTDLSKEKSFHVVFLLVLLNTRETSVCTLQCGNETQAPSAQSCELPLLSHYFSDNIFATQTGDDAVAGLRLGN